MGQFKKTSTKSSSDFAIECDKADSINSLQGQLLIASPHIDDIRFKKSVIMICQHDAQSAMGLVINKQANSLKLGDLYEKLEIGAPSFAVEDPVHIGGPVDSNRGFVLHSQDHMLPDSLAITNEISLTASVEILRDITGGVGPSHTIVSLGCAGWSAGQLDREMSENVWLNLPASTDLVFEHSRETLWQQAFDTIGINPAFFAGDIGSA